MSVFKNLEKIVKERKDFFENTGNIEDNGKKMYTSYLFSKGLDKILKKCGEECTEMVIAAKNHDNAELTLEISDLIYHIMVVCVQQNLPFQDIVNELELRSNKIGNLKKFTEVDKNS